MNYCIQHFKLRELHFSNLREYINSYKRCYGKKQLTLKFVYFGKATKKMVNSKLEQEE